MRLLITLLVATVSLLADTSDRLPNTRKAPLPFGAPKRGAPRSTGMRLTPHAPRNANAKAPVQKRQKNGAIGRTFNRPSAAPGKAQAKAHRAPHRK
jgi:hypothetical protein